MWFHANRLSWWQFCGQHLWSITWSTFHTFCCIFYLWLHPRYLIRIMCFMWLQKSRWNASCRCSSSYYDRFVRQKMPTKILKAITVDETCQFLWRNVNAMELNCIFCCWRWKWVFERQCELFSLLRWNFRKNSCIFSCYIFLTKSITWKRCAFFSFFSDTWERVKQCFRFRMACM